MSEKQMQDNIQKICAIIDERDKKLCEMHVKCKYYKNVIETAENEIKIIRADIKRITDENNEVQEQLNKTDDIFKSLQDNQDTLTQSLVNHQTLEKMITRELEAKQIEAIKIEEKFRTLYEDSKLKMTDNLRYKELKQARLNFRKANIELREVNVQLAQKKMIIAEKREIQKKKFYAFFIHMAEDYVSEKKMKELRALKEQELAAIKTLFEYQERVKERQKLGIPKMKKIENIIFGNQDHHIEKRPQIQNKQSSHNEIQAQSSQNLKQSQPLQQQNLVTTLREKLNRFKQEEDSDLVEIPQKVRFIEHHVVVPATTASKFTIPENLNCPIQETTVTNLSKIVQIAIKSTGSKMCRYQQPKSVAPQSSQQLEFPQLSQECKSQEVTNVVPPIMEIPLQPAIPEQRRSKVVKLSKKWQKMINTTVSKERLSQQTENPASQLSQQSDLAQSSQESQSPGETTGCDTMSVQTLSKNPISLKSILTPAECKIQGDASASSTFLEPTKSIRFNMESKHQPEEGTGMFAQGMFENPFQTFFERKADQNNTTGSVPPEDTMCNTSGADFNTSLNVFNNTDPFLNFDDGVSNQEEQFNAPEAGPFRVGGMFSFGLNKSLFPF